MLPLILTAVIATDIAVVVMFFTLRRQNAVAAGAAFEAPDTGEIEELVAAMRSQLDQSAVELSRQKAQLRRMLEDLERQHAKPEAPAPPPIVTRRDMLRMAAEGLSMRAIAGRTGMSVEEVRLMLAMDDDTVAA